MNSLSDLKESLNESDNKLIPIPGPERGTELLAEAQKKLENLEIELQNHDGLTFAERKKQSKKILVPFFTALAQLMEEERLPQRSIQRSGEFFCKFQWQAQLPGAPDEDRVLQLAAHEFNEDNFSREDLVRFMALGWYMSVCNGPLPARTVPMGVDPPPPTNLIDAQRYVGENAYPLVEGPDREPCKPT